MSRSVFWDVEFDCGLYSGRWNFSVATNTVVLVFIFHHISMATGFAIFASSVFVIFASHDEQQ